MLAGSGRPRGRFTRPGVRLGLTTVDAANTHHRTCEALYPARLLPISRAVLSQTCSNMSAFSTYLIGFIILIVGLAIAAYLLNVPTTWIAVGVIVLIGIGVLMATSRTKPRDPPSSSSM